MYVEPECACEFTSGPESPPEKSWKRLPPVLRPLGKIWKSPPEADQDSVDGLETRNGASVLPPLPLKSSDLIVCCGAANAAPVSVQAASSARNSNRQPFVNIICLLGPF